MQHACILSVHCVFWNFLRCLTMGNIYSDNLFAISSFFWNLLKFPGNITASFVFLVNFFYWPSFTVNKTCKKIIEKHACTQGTRCPSSLNRFTVILKLKPSPKLLRQIILPCLKVTFKQILRPFLLITITIIFICFFCKPMLIFDEHCDLLWIYAIRRQNLDSSW